MIYNYTLKYYMVSCLILAATVAPAFGQLSIRSALSDDREASPGSSYEGEIRVHNETDEIQQAKIYQTDYLFYSDGSNIYGDPGTADRSNATWATISTNILSIPPHETVPVSYVVHVPQTLDGQNLGGSYWSMVMVEAIPRNSAESTISPETGEQQYGVLQIMRYGIQLATHISGTGSSILNMSETGLSRLDEGGSSLELNISNTGDRMVRPDMWVELYDENGAAFGRHDGVKSRIYPGTSIHQRINLGQLEPGNYRALVIIDAGADEVYGAEYQLAVN
jgi:hypothetical protein